MRALRSRAVQTDCSNEEQKTLNVVSDKIKRRKDKRNKKASKQAESHSESIESAESAFTKSPEHKMKKKKGKQGSTYFEESKNIRNERTTRHSVAVNITKGSIKENVSPNSSIENDVKKKKNKKSRRSPEFKNVTSTAIKPKPDSPKKQNKTRLSETTTNRKSSLSSTFEKCSPTFKNIVTSTTIKPKKRKLSNTNNKSDNILLQNDSEILRNDIINISDSDITTKIPNITDALNSTYIKLDEVESKITTTNNSGQWKIEQQSIINISDDIKNQPNLNESIENNKNVKKVIFQEVTKSARKKWQRFARNSQGANSVLEQITPQKKSLPNKSLKEESNKKTNSIKRTVMPNFALIHQKAFEKMESITEYSQRKKNRAQLLLSNKKPTEDETVETKTKATSSRQLFNETDPKKFNRFGFKVNQTVKPSIYTRDNIVPLANNTVPTGKLQENKKEIIYARENNVAIANKKMPTGKLRENKKEMIFARENIVAIANKKVQTGKFRENKREMLKGVRTNRRFELLMKMRNN